jgi:putative ATPase
MGKGDDMPQLFAGEEMPAEAKSRKAGEGREEGGRAGGGEAAGRRRPLADVLRPQSLEEVVGQPHLTGPEGTLTRLLAAGRLPSLILWGPPGTGKTTIARLLARATDDHFEQISAIFTGVGELKKVFAAARERQKRGQGTILFVDEIHRFNRAQQDSFLPVVEDGTITLIGATTENPSFELNGALLSRCQVLVLKRLDPEALETLLARAEASLGGRLPLREEARAALVAMADGDGRYLLNMAEAVAAAHGVRARGAAKEEEEEAGLLDAEALRAFLRQRLPLYDKSRDGHYNLISALHKSVRGSDPDAALYWLARMLEAGEDPLYVARRLVRMASEDIGLADPMALQQALAAREAYEQLGSPEGELALAQAVVYLATAPKSNALYRAFGAAQAAARRTGSLMPPKIILNAPTRLMKEEGYGQGYLYDHDQPDAFSGQDYFPPETGRMTFYDPPERGFEREIRRRLQWWARLREKRRAQRGEEGE